MKEWTIPVCWEMCGTVTIQANTLDEAMEIARDDDGNLPLPADANYIDDSWNLSHDDAEEIRCCYNGGQQDEITEEKSKK